MFLKKILIKNFRSIKEMELSLNKGLNVIIGENGTGKSALIDALRISFGYGKQWRDIGIRNDEDFFIDVTNINFEIEPIEFHLYFEIESPEDRHYFQSMVHQDEENPEIQDIQIHFRYRLEKNEKGSNILRWENWGGSVEGQSIKVEEAQLIYFTYLAALRNAEQELRPYAKENKITSLFRELQQYKTKDDDGNEKEIDLTDERKHELAQKLQKVIEDRDWYDLIKTGESFVNHHLEKADIEDDNTNVEIKLLEYKYENVIKGVLTRKPVFKTELLNGDPSNQLFFDVSQNGLGENNLIYASAVLGDLENRRKEGIEHYYALLIEEPEAHLHPQRQSTFFNYLNSLGDFNVQIFITSHSPTLTSKIDLDNLIVFKSTDNLIGSFSLKECELDPTEKQYLKRFLDVTKSQLFFAKGVILVEGISEALLLPVLTKKIGKNLDKSGIEIVNINGVAFAPFAKLFNSADATKRLSSRCSIISDGDEHRNSGLLSARATKLEDLKPDDPTNLDIFIAENTFEYELMVQSVHNADVMRTVYRQLHPRTDLLEGTNLSERAFELLDKLDQNKDKGVFAQKLTEHLENNQGDFDEFEVPEYLTESINWVT